ncbi:hypothetical protein JKY72_04725 [Candidatus Gracilibacteria bacterium]|nr:hypothetical protein [Candidatus Gracilibacteria bacterium]
MKNKKMIIAMALVLVAGFSAWASASPTLFQGDTRGGGGERGNEATVEISEDLPWWCVESCPDGTVLWGYNVDDSLVCVQKCAEGEAMWGLKEDGTAVCFEECPEGYSVGEVTEDGFVCEPILEEGEEGEIPPPIDSPFSKYDPLLLTPQEPIKSSKGDFDFDSQKFVWNIGDRTPIGLIIPGRDGTEVEDPGTERGDPGYPTVAGRDAGNGRGSGTGTPGIPQVPIDIPGAPSDEEITYDTSCECGESIIDVSISELGYVATLECPSKFGSKVVHQLDKNVQVTIYSPEEYQCKDKWQCPEGTEMKYEEVDEECEPWEKVAANKSLECNGGEVSSPLQVSDFPSECPAFNGNLQESLDEAQAHFDDLTCISKEDCLQYAEDSSNGVTGLGELINNCNDLYSGKGGGN